MRVLRTERGFRLDTEDVAADAVARHLSLYKVGRDVKWRRSPTQNRSCR